jgi:hypothetical protein
MLIPALYLVAKVKQVTNITTMIKRGYTLHDCLGWTKNLMLARDGIIQAYVITK